MDKTTQSAVAGPVEPVLGPPPWADDVEAWLEASNAEEIADDIERYTLAQVARAVAEERERIRQVFVDYGDEGALRLNEAWRA